MSEVSKPTSSPFPKEHLEPDEDWTPREPPWKWMFFALVAGNLVGFAWAVWETWG